MQYRRPFIRERNGAEFHVGARRSFWGGGLRNFGHVEDAVYEPHADAVLREKASHPHELQQREKIPPPSIRNRKTVGRYAVYEDARESSSTAAGMMNSGVAESRVRKPV